MENEEDRRDDEALDASSLAGTSQYSATGGGTQALHDPRGAHVDDEEPDGDSIAEMYRYSLGRATQDAAPGRTERWVDGPLHLDDPRHDGR
ncbi:MAG TPA: hypothetical protein RMH99_08400 [Sandaracinaceae bacterium LLY-WYZ-13_1]|nr:hypothetical protein [Sandaracinaceae bacterium LLY-WYZ-13_1]